MRGADCSAVQGLIIPLWTFPVALLLILFASALIMLGKGLILAGTVSRSKPVVGKWPSNFDSGTMTADAKTERELVCTAIELLQDRPIPDAFRCPVSLTVMRDPVLLSGT